MNVTPTALWLVPVPDIGGVARHVLDATRLGIPGWRIVVMCPEGALAEALRAQGSAVQAAAFGPDAGVVASVRSLIAAVNALRPKIVHSHLAYADIIAAFTWLPDGVRRVSTEHGIAGNDSVYHESEAKARVMAAAHTLRQRRFAARIAVSEATAQAMREKWAVQRQIIVIPNGVDAPELERVAGDPSAPRILSLSRLAPEKRLDKLIEAFALLRQGLPGATLTIAGSGPLEGELREQISQLGLADAVSLPGFVDAESAMAEADAIVQLSVWENASYTLLDAVARGIPVVAARVGGNPEIVSEASLVDADNVVEVAGRIRAALGRKELTSRPISVAQMTRRIGNVYDRVAA
ncbi:Glycosyltransferase [Gulosibacter molinativorax]|nr:Glycosyltransferase [Gulosibacter molinativorax]